MDMANERDSWLSRNDWIKPLIAGVILILAPLLATTCLDGSGFVFPAWLKILSNVGALFGLFFGIVRARLTDTLSAQIFCYLIAGVLAVVAIWQVIEIFKHW